MAFNVLGVVKFVATGLVGMGTTKIVKNVISNHVTIETPLDKIAVAAASLMITGIVGTATKKFADEAIDDVVSTVKDTIDSFKTQAKLDRIAKGASTFEKEGLDEAEFIKNEKDKWVRRPDSAPTEDDRRKEFMELLEKAVKASGIDFTRPSDDQ